MTVHRSRFHLRRLHRLIGISAAVGLLWLAVSGLILLYADSLDLARTPLPTWLARWYGVATQSVQLTADGHLLEHDGHWKFDGKTVTVALHPPQIFLRGPGGLYYAIADDGVAIFMADSTLVESLPAATFVATQLTHAGGNELIVCVGDAQTRCTRDGAEWQPTVDALPALTPIGGASAVINLERFVLDLHAGRFLGPARKAVWSAFSLALIFLAVSGLRIALAVRRRTHALHDPAHDPAHAQTHAQTHRASPPSSSG